VSAIARRFCIPLGLLLLVTLAYWKLALPGAPYVWFDHYDMCELKTPRLQFLARNLHQGRFPLWEPHMWAGQPTLGAGQPGLVYPLTLLFLALPLEDGGLSPAVLNWLFLAMHFTGALFFYLLCRDRGLNRWASAFGATAFSCAGYVGSVPWLDIGHALMCTPLIFLFTLRLWGGAVSLRNCVGLAAALGASWLTGHHEIPLLNSYVVVLGTAAVALYRLAKRRRAEFRMTALVAAALLLGAGLSALQTLPMGEFGRLSKRWVEAPEPIGWSERVPYYVHAQYSVPWEGLRGLVIPIDDPEIFVGFTVAALALAGLAGVRAERWLLHTAMIGLGGLIYSLGAHTPLHRLLYEALPMLDKARTPVRGLFLVTFAISVLGAYGAHRLLERLPRYRAAAAVALLALLLAETARVSWRRMTPFDPARSVCATELVSHRDLAGRLRAEPGLGRITANWSEVMTNLGDLYGFDQLQSFVAAVPANVLRHELQSERTGQLFGVTHHVGKTPVAATDTPIATFARGVRLFRKPPGALPQAWVAHEALRVGGDPQLRQAIQNRAIDLRRTAVMLEATPPLETCAGGEPVEVERPDTDRVVLRARLGCRGLMVLSDAYYPGWRATVDGNPAPIYEAYGALRGVVVEAGAHTVEMRYRPAVVWVGLGVSTTTLLLLVVLALRRSAAA
jgi:hypothetical protein